jgi:hypothetical protein
MVEDKYLEKFYSIKQKKLLDNRKFKEGYKTFQKQDNFETKPVYQKSDSDKADEILMKKELPSLNSDRKIHLIGEYLALASKLMSSNSLGDVFRGAQIYEKFGQGNRASVKRRLLKAVDKTNIYFFPNDFVNSIGDFFKRNPSKLNIESRVLPSVFGAITLAGILFGANGFTGAVVGITEKSSLTLGVDLFLAGILGLFISRGKF